MGMCLQPSHFPFLMLPQCQGSPCSVPQSHSKACLSTGGHRPGLQVCHMYLRCSGSQGRAVTLGNRFLLTQHKSQVPRTMTVRANARKHLGIATWAPGCHCPHFTDDQVSQTGEVQCLTVSLQAGSGTHAQNHTTCTTSLEKQPEPCLPPKTLLPDSLLHTEISWSLLQTLRRAAQMSQRLLFSMARRPYRAQPQPGAQQSLEERNELFPTLAWAAASPKCRELG